MRETSQSDEKGGEKRIESGSGDAYGDDSKVKNCERGKGSIAKENVQCLSFWLHIARWKHEGTGRNVNKNAKGETKTER